MRGFAMSMAVLQWARQAQNAPLLQEPPEFIIENLTGPFYYYCWPFRKEVVEELKLWLKRIDDGTIEAKIPIAKDIREIIVGATDDG